MGYVTLEPHGGQVPWHNQEQEEIYFVISEGTGEMCLGEERREMVAGPDRSDPARRLPPAHQHRRRAAEDDLLLRPGRRRGPLATGTGRHPAEGGRRCARPAGRRTAAVHRPPEGGPVII